MDASEAREFLARCGQAAARREAEHIDDQVRMWLRCGYELDELRLLHFVHPREPSEVVPASFECPDGGPSCPPRRFSASDWDTELPASW